MGNIILRQRPTLGNKNSESMRQGKLIDALQSLYKLLTNVAYVGKVRYKDEVHDGEHALSRRLG